MSKLEYALMILQLCLAVGNLSIMIFALSKFIKKPHDKLIDRVVSLEVKVEELQDSLKQGNDRFREYGNRFEKQYDTNEVLIRSILALIEFEMQYCIEEKKGLTDGLKNAKADLEKFLARKYKDQNAM